MYTQCQEMSTTRSVLDAYGKIAKPENGEKSAQHRKKSTEYRSSEYGVDDTAADCGTRSKTNPTSG
jgi:hypothetical protein